MKYPVARDGEWITPRRRGYVVECCDCGLRHRVDLRLVRYVNGGRVIQYRATRIKKRGGAK